jgi:CHAD domain-containing protein
MRDYARQQTSILLRRLAFQINRTATSGTPDSIHDLRVAVRRLSRCLRVFSQFYPDGSWKKLRRDLAELLEAGGEVRDRDIAIELLAQAGISPRAAVVTRLGAERHKAANKLLLELRRWKRGNFSRKWRSRLELSV